ncbi:MAG: BNR repeat-containing protein [Planctomycetes bacterium]|nr:BNR repeat-containing protein [Planctomycetota bacterium]
MGLRKILAGGILVLFVGVVGFCVGQEGPRVERSVAVGQVWSGHRVGFCLLTEGQRQYVAYYDAKRRMTVAMRTLGSKEWEYQKLDSALGWDSHNYVTMAVDAGGYVHLSGNMHCVPLVYFRTSEPYDIHSFKRLGEMVGREEKRCTYPKFFEGAAGELIFTYRDGGSGNGNQIYNVYDAKAKRWRRLLDKPLTDGQGLMNAYIVGPVRGPDGYFHICWVWRDTPNCYTNHDLSYARSRDMVHWETVRGGAIELPMTIDTKGIVVDAVPVKGGMINGNTRIGFDSKKRVVISYHKFDEDGKTQVYNARFEGGRWRICRASDWDYRWFFEGGGTIHFEIRVSGVVLEDGYLTQSYNHDKYGSGAWKLDESSLKPLGEIEKVSAQPKELKKLESDFPGMQLRLSRDSGESGQGEVEYVLRWETLGVNRDRRREKVPEPSMLRVYKLRGD